MDLKDLDAFERESQQRLRSAIDALRPGTIAVHRFHMLLLQRKEISFEFTGTYDSILTLLSPHAAVSVPIIRRIIREEYPDSNSTILPRGDLPSHREDLITDLRSIGVSPESIHESDATLSTIISIMTVREIISKLKRTSFPDVSLLAFLRFWGEALTAVEYRQFWPRIQSLLAGRGSVFYKPHFEHDERRVDLAEIERNTTNNTHADELSAALVSLLPASGADRDAALSCAELATSMAIDHKLRFYEQFRSGLAWSSEA